MLSSIKVTRSSAIFGERSQIRVHSLSEYHWSTGVTYFSLDFKAVPEVSSVRLYHFIVGSLLITHCNLLCSFHCVYTIFGKVNANKS